jgi:hypothetical protein
MTDENDPKDVSQHQKQGLAEKISDVGQDTKDMTSSFASPLSQLDQSPVSWLGWTSALMLGAALWLTMIYLLG